MQTTDIILIISFIAIATTVFVIGLMVLRARAESPQRKLSGAKTPEELVQAHAFTMNLEVVERNDDELAKDLRRRRLLLSDSATRSPFSSGISGNNGTCHSLFDVCRGRTAIADSRRCDFHFGPF